MLGDSSFSKTLRPLTHPKERQNIVPQNGLVAQ